ncbi:hypothetical protein [Caloranaerobacter azorensis]|uniref:Uncharacterized protein n=3 Tax=Caloranaerobacter azorensis TaxID=116090 RepID=A0A1M5TE90_9FIRM|nr:hypothetical protein [Caloranaerobacter azorensis]KGG80095.1 hypothetical protein Y919_08185 [Caloranaerobacter azorensis H53214]QIB27064.1 hypothetical protein G3A45_07025 [Caloranaerobacter azorensis]SHH49016.1 hypothetical protein SAMN02745135_00963 [Caloranaerobacter azorensis DSM 13643]
MVIKDIEQFINQIKSVLSCKIVADENGSIQEIHILSDTKRSPKQVSRDVQSGLISRFGLDIDHKKISIAQIDEKVAENKDFRLKLKTIEFSTLGTKVFIKVILEKDEEVFEGEISGINTVSNSQRLLGTAALKAVEKFLGTEDNFILEDIKTIELAGREVVVSAVTFVTNNYEKLLSGCAFVNRDKKEAVVKATLDAINRSIIRHYSGN